MAKATFDIKTEVTKPLYAGVGATDLAVELVRGYVATAQERFAKVQKDVQGFEFKPQALRDQAVTVVNARVDSISKDAKARRAAIEARVAELQKQAQKQAQTLPEAYGDLIGRGEKLVGRVRRQQSTQQTVKSAKTTTAKAKTTKTQGAKKASSTAKATKTAAKKTAAKKTGTKSSAKATATAAKKTATSAAKATTDAAAKVGD